MSDRLRSHVWLLIAAAFVAADLIANLAFGPTSSYVGLLALVPMIVSFELDWRGVAVISAVMLVLSATNLFGFDQGPAHSVIIHTVGVAVGAALGIFASIYRIRREHALVESRAVAAVAQRAILPLVPGRLGPFLFASEYRSALREASIGGDFYKVVETPFGVRLIVGDVQGKGLGAVGTAAVLLGCFREWAPEITSLTDLVAVLDARVKTHGDAETFVTAVVATLTDRGLLELANCGHPWPVHFHDGEATLAGPRHTTVPLGLSPEPEVQSVFLTEGDRFLIYTDGLVDNRDASGRWVPLEDIVTGTGHGRFDTALARLLARLSARVGDPQDDMALLLVGVGGLPGGAPGSRLG